MPSERAEKWGGGLRVLDFMTRDIFRSLAPKRCAWSRFNYSLDGNLSRRLGTLRDLGRVPLALDKERRRGSMLAFEISDAILSVPMSAPGGIFVGLWRYDSIILTRFLTLHY